MANADWLVSPSFAQIHVIILFFQPYSDLVAAGDELDVVYHVVAERLLGELGRLARQNPKLKSEKFSEKQKAIEAGFELGKTIARDIVLNGSTRPSYQKEKSAVEVNLKT